MSFTLKTEMYTPSLTIKTTNISGNKLHRNKINNAKIQMNN
jgi:hypothetical protein